MTRSTAALAVVASIVLAMPAAASASYYLAKPQAEHLVRDYFHQRGYFGIGAYCRPQGLPSAQSGYIYHRWTCGFAVSNSSYSHACVGTVLIVGSHAPGSYYARINDRRGPGCP